VSLYQTGNIVFRDTPKSQTTILYMGPIIDKVKLVLFAILILIISISLTVIITKYGISKSWQLFSYGCIIYISGVIYLVISFVSKSKRTISKYIALSIIVCVVIGLSFFALRTNMLSMPTNLTAYLVLSMIMAPVTFLLLDYCILSRNDNKRI
jgi:hypothetical protein